MKTISKRTKTKIPKPTDYVKISRKLFAGQTVDEIFARSKARSRIR